MKHKILSYDDVKTTADNLHEADKKIVLVGGCFDILHAGHIAFLEKAKEQGDILIVFIESDAHIKQLKGPHRPVNKQLDRAMVLSHLTIVDYVVPLPDVVENKTYDDLVIQIKPAIIATTAGDKYRHYKERQADMVGAQVVDVIGSIENQSTTRILKILRGL